MPYNVLITLCHTGAISDSSASTYRRRYWIWASTAALSIVTVTLAYVEPIGAFLVAVFSNTEDWNPDRRRLVRRVLDHLAWTHLSIGGKYGDRSIYPVFLRP